MAHAVQDTDKLTRILQVIDELNNLKDLDTILDKILQEARRFTGAEAGSIFLAEGERLRFSYVHNEQLFKKGETHKSVYANISLPISDESIAGYVALTGETLVIDDAYDLPGDRPFGFDSSYDERSGFRTRSVMSVPLKTQQGKLVGVMQIINPRDPEGAYVTFGAEAQQFVSLFANTAAVNIERGLMTREIILRMMKMAEMRDPKETGAHVQRVGAYSAEIYQKLAFSRGLDSAEVKTTKDLIRLAGMLHDVGKVGISDAILKKPARLTHDEFSVMKMHTVMGARLFVTQTSELDQMCRVVALTHHERWAGGGYPGRVEVNTCQIAEGEPLSGKDIPLVGRITALADVYDALSSRRSYKEPWPEERVLDVIQQESGRHFDPAVVDAFFDIYDVIRAIRERYREPEYE
jgi:HD-GYP domain-containing protein (c-di-GMP phosphodiesterase class II)